MVPFAVGCTWASGGGTAASGWRRRSRLAQAGVGAAVQGLGGESRNDQQQQGRQGGPHSPAINVRSVGGAPQFIMACVKGKGNTRLKHLALLAAPPPPPPPNRHHVAARMAAERQQQKQQHLLSSPAAAVAVYRRQSAAGWSWMEPYAAASNKLASPGVAWLGFTLSVGMLRLLSVKEERKWQSGEMQSGGLGGSRQDYFWER